MIPGKTYNHTIGGKTFFVEINDWAEQANGSVLVRVGDTVILTTAVMAKNPREGGDFFPLTVDYEEKYYASGKILGSRFIKRETRPSEEAILAMRLIDRSVRPRFDLRVRNEVQVIVTILSIDEQNDPDIPALLGASLALSLSDIPWNGPIAGVRVGRVDDSFILNPTYEERVASALDLTIAGTAERINMIEADAKELTEEVCIQAAEWGHGFVKDLIAFQETVARENSRKKIEIPIAEPPEKLRSAMESEFSERLEAAMYQREKRTAYESLSTLETEWMERAAHIAPDFARGVFSSLLHDELNGIIHRRILEKRERPDGRRPDELRSLRASVGLLPRVHGSGLFMRGETHALATLTLGAPGDEQIVEGMEIRTKKRFLLHYNFPPFSTGETKPLRGPGRREIGHGALAHKAIASLLPSKEEFPYTIRVVSEILSSNGSSSMASVSAASLALMDAGVPIKKPVAGVAMGLMQNGKGDYCILTDLAGQEDHHGDMDFKVAGTRDGITAVQLDVKIEGITFPMIRDTFIQAKKAREEVLDLMESVIARPRPELSPYAPRVITLKINPEKIGALIGPGGKVINSIIEDTGVQIDIEDDGTVFITSINEEGMKKALSLVKQITRELKPGEMLEGKVTRIFDFGAMVEVGPRQEGLIHISELAPWRVEKVTDVINVGDTVPVRVKNIDEQGRVNLSLKDAEGRYSETDRRRGERAHPPGRYRSPSHAPHPRRHHSRP
jgi:polyribonucleotide nucleotidyltransferase